MDAYQLVMKIQQDIVTSENSLAAVYKNLIIYICHTIIIYIPYNIVILLLGVGAF